MDNQVVRYTRELQYLRLKFRDEFVNAFKERIVNRLSEEEEWQKEIKQKYENFDYLKALQKCFALFLFKEEIVIQEWTAILRGMLNCSTMHRTGLAVSYALMSLFESQCFTSNRFEDRWFIRCIVKIDLDISKVGYLLPSLEPLQKVSKFNLGYKEFNERILCGSKLNPMEGDFVLSHINKLNSIQFMYDPRISDLIGFRFDNRDKVKGDHIETPEEKEERKQAFNLLRDQLLERRELIQGKPMYIAHKYDKRGRTYCKAYEFNYMGIKPIKASIRFARGEKIDGEI